MNGRSNRRKGVEAEREVRDLLIAYGFQARRDGRLDDDLDHNLPGVHLEVKRREVLAIPEWWRQAERDAKGRHPVLLFRQSRQPWWAEMSAVYYTAHVQPHLADSQNVYITRHGRFRMLLTTLLAALAAAQPTTPTQDTLPLEGQEGSADEVLAPCPRCRGTGHLRYLDPMGTDVVVKEHECPTCAGTGQYNTNDIPF